MMPGRAVAPQQKGLIQILFTPHVSDIASVRLNILSAFLRSSKRFRDGRDLTLRLKPATIATGVNGAFISSALPVELRKFE